MTEIFLFISVLAAVGGIAGAVTITQRLFGRLDAIESGRSTGQLSDEVQRLQLEVGELQSEIQSLTERLDFTEKLLAAPTDESGPTRAGDEGA